MSCVFLDGPAATQILMLHRAPLLLRVVRGADGSWDALDQPADAARRDEQVFVYCRQEAHPTTMHICCRPRKGSGWYQCATYLHMDEPIPEVILRDTRQWADWVTANKLLLFVRVAQKRSQHDSSSSRA